MEKKEAIKLCIEKFEYIAKYGWTAWCTDRNESIKFGTYIHACPLCELYIKYKCKGCPLLIDDVSCKNEHSLFRGVVLHGDHYNIHAIEIIRQLTCALEKFPEKNACME